MYNSKMTNNNQPAFNSTSKTNKSEILRKIIPSFLILIAGLMITFVICNTEGRSSENEKRAYFELRVRDVYLRIEKRINSYEQILRSVRGLFHASEHVNRDEFNLFFNALQLDENYPGIQGVGFSKIILRDELSKHIDSVRIEGFSEYKIWPEGSREIYTSIIYLEPFRDRNLRAFGYDMFSEPVRRQAMEISRDSNDAVLSGKVTLVQETDEAMQTGFLIYLPVFRNGKPYSNVSERRENIIGWVYSPFRMNDFMYGLFGELASDLDVEVFDGKNISNETKMYDSETLLTEHTPIFTSSKILDFDGREWTVIVKSTPVLEDRLGTPTTRNILIIGIGLSLLLAVITYLIVSKKVQIEATNKERIQAKESLQESEEKYKFMFSNNPQPMWIYDLETLAFLEVNSAAVNHYDYTREEFLSMTLKDIRPEEDIEALLRDVELTRRAYNPSGEWRHVKKNGEVINVEITSHSVMFNNRKARHVMAIDITERKQIEDALKESETIFNHFMENSPYYVFFKDKDIRALRLSANYEKMLGKPLNEILGKTMDELFPSELAKKMVEDDKRILDKRETVVVEEELNGRYYTTIKFPIIIDNIPTYLAGFTIDITERKKKEIELKESEEKFRIITENSADAIFITDNQGRFLYVNNKAVQLLGYTTKEMLSFSIADISPMNRVDEYYQLLKNLLKEGYTFNEVELVKKNGETLPIDVNAVLLPNGLIYGSCRDITERMNAEKALRESEDRYRDLVENSSDLICTHDLEGNILSVNNAALKITGYSKEEVLKMNMKDILVPIYRRIFGAYLTKIKRVGQAQGLMTIQTKTGEKRIWEYNNTLRTQGVDKPIVRGMVRDITGYKKVEGELKILSRAVEQSPASIIITNIDGNIEYINPKVTQITGFTPEEVIGKNPRIFNSGEKLKIDYKVLWETISSGKEWRGEFHNKKKNGELYWESASISPIMNEKGIITHYLAVKEDITEQKRAEQEIISQKNKFAQLFDNSPVAIALSDEHNKIININEAFIELFGYAREELIDFPLNEIIVPKELKEESMAFSRATQSGRQTYKESYRQRKDGSNIFVQIIGIPILLNDKIMGIYGMYVDLTHRKDAEEKLKVAKELAEQSDKLKSEFLAQMSHEIRTPINVMLGYTNYLNELVGENKNSETNDCFRGIELASKRIIRTVDLILNAAQLQTSGYLPNFVTIDLDSDILNKLKHEYEQSAEQKGLELNYICEIKNTEITVDEYSVTQIFANLIDNAIKYTKRGKVEILLRKNNNGNIIVEVKDTGIGISKEFLPKLFVSFTQEEQGYSRSFEGNGLGLALVKSYCDINNALIEVESEKNVGSTFRVIFNNTKI